MDGREGRVSRRLEVVGRISDEPASVYNIRPFVGLRLTLISGSNFILMTLQEGGQCDRSGKINIKL